MVRESAKAPALYLPKTNDNGTWWEADETGIKKLVLGQQDPDKPVNYNFSDAGESYTWAELDNNAGRTKGNND